MLEGARQCEAAADFPAVVALLKDIPHDELLAEPELGFTLATALRRVGEWERAYALTHALGAACARQGRASLARRRLNLEAALHFDRGHLHEAEVRWAELVDVASREEDDRMTSDACNNLGVVFTLLARTDEALASYARALAAAQRLGDVRGMAQAHQNLAIAYRELGFLHEAGSHFERAVEHASAAGIDEILGRAEEERALVMLAQGDARLAEATATRALNRFRSRGDRAGQGEALRVLGIIALARRRFEDAHAHLDDALELARACRAPLLEAETLEAIGALHAVESRRGEDAATSSEPPAAEHALQAAERIFAAMGAEGWGRQLRAGLRALIASRPR